MTNTIRPLSGNDAWTPTADLDRKLSDGANNLAHDASKAVDSAKAKVADGAAMASDALSSAAQTAKSSFAGAAQAASDGLRTASQNIGDAASGAGDAIANQAAGAKRVGADAVAGLASGVRGVADSIDEQSPRVAGMVRSAADGADTLSKQIREGDFNELVTAITDFTRRRPGIALAIGVIAGIAITRLLRVSNSA
jgi:uncharacterized phage infection (PIP) family protein YhgE